MTSRPHSKMKNKIEIPLSFLMALTLLAGALFSACNRDYSSDDAVRMVRSNRVKAELVSEEERDEDTVWTFREKGKRGLEFQVIEDHYMTGIDSSEWEASRLYSNYSAVLTRYYLDRYDGIDGQVRSEDRNGYLYGTTLEYTFTDRDDLRRKLRDLDRFAAFVKKGNRSNGGFFGGKESYSIRARFEFDGSFHFSESGAAGSGTLGDLEDRFLNYAISYNDTEQLSFFSSREIRSRLEEYDGRIYVKRGDMWEPTRFATLTGNTAMPRTSFYALRKREGLQVTGTPDSYTVVSAGGEEVFIDSSFDRGNGWVSFYKAREILGCEINGKWAIDTD